MNITTRSYVGSGHKRRPKEMEANLEAGIEEADGNPAYIAKTIGSMARD